MTEPGGEPNPPAIRIGTAERNAALAALDAHLEAGRLDAMEYGDRSARVAEARTADEVRPLFADLPAPHPQLPGDAPGGLAATPSDTAPAERSGSGGLRTWGPRLVALLPLAAVALFLLVPGHIWLFFLLIPAAGALAGRARGHGDDPDHGHDHGHDHRRHGHGHGHGHDRRDGGPGNEAGREN